MENIRCHRYPNGLSTPNSCQPIQHQQTGTASVRERFSSGTRAWPTLLYRKVLSVLGIPSQLQLMHRSYRPRFHFLHFCFCFTRLAFNPQFPPNRNAVVTLFLLIFFFMRMLFITSNLQILRNDTKWRDNFAIGIGRLSFVHRLCIFYFDIFLSPLNPYRYQRSDATHRCYTL